MKIPFFSSLRWRFAAATLVLVGVLLLAVTGVLTLFLQQAVDQDTDESLRSLLSARAAQIEALSQKFEGQLRASTVFGAAADDTNRRYSDEIETNSWFPPSGIGAASAGGAVIDVHDRDWFQELASGQNLAVGKAVVS